MNTGRKPDWTLCVKGEERWINIGAAWETEKGNLFIKLDEGETLRGTAMLFPYREKPTGGGYRRPTMRPAPPAEGDYMERKRRERANGPLPITPPPEMDPDPEPPEWL